MLRTSLKRGLMLTSYLSMKHTRFCSMPSYQKYNYFGAKNKPSLLLQNNHLDTSIWDEINIVESDIFLVGSAKSGTTWMNEIITQLLYQHIDDKSLIPPICYPTLSPFRNGGATKQSREQMIENMNKQLSNTDIKHRLFKFHEPVESIPFHENCRYIFVSRDFRDIIWSFYKHYANYTESVINEINKERYNFELINKMPLFDSLNKNDDFTEYAYWKMSIEVGDDFGNPDGYPFWSQLWVIGSWLNVYNDYNNMKIIHFNEMQNDLRKVISDTAQFLHIPIENEDKFKEIVEDCSFDAMKSKQQYFGEAGKMWWKEPNEFFYKGTNNRWKNILTENDILKYHNLAKRYLNEQQIHWLEFGHHYS